MGLAAASRGRGRESRSEVRSCEQSTPDRNLPNGPASRRPGHLLGSIFSPFLVWTSRRKMPQARAGDGPCAAVRECVWRITIRRTRVCRSWGPKFGLWHLYRSHAAAYGLAYVRSVQGRMFDASCTPDDL